MTRMESEPPTSTYGRRASDRRYRPCFELASGGMGTVFLARTEDHGAAHPFVALKRVHRTLVENENLVQMFLDEVRIASRIHHPNVCSVVDFETGHPDYFIVMEYLVGEPVSRAFEVLKGGLEPERAIGFAARIVAEACEGLHAAHELRDDDGLPLEVVHRDVSPENLFVTYDGAVKVLDFGLVRAARSSHTSQVGIVKGKCAYVSPEALASNPIDRRADVWGLGVVLWELLTGRRLFKRDSDARTLLAIAAGEVPLPSTLNPAISSELDAVVMRALSQEAADRYPTARELGHALSAFGQVGGRPLGTRDVSQMMDELFPGGRDRSRRMLEVAAQAAAEVPTASVTPVKAPVPSSPVSRPDGPGSGLGVVFMAALAAVAVLFAYDGAGGASAFRAESSLAPPAPMGARECPESALDTKTTSQGGEKASP